MATAQPCAAPQLPDAEWKGFATRQTTTPSAKAPATRQCFSLPRQNRIALETSLPLQTGMQLFVRQSSITNRAFSVAFEHGRFHSSVDQLFIPVFADGVAIGQFLDRIFSRRHPADAPCI